MAKLSQKIIQTQKLTPQQILNVNIIQLNSNVIEKRILDEIESNPALEVNVSEEEDIRNDCNEEDNNDFEWDELISNPEEYRVKPRNYKKSSAEFNDSLVHAPYTLSDELLSQLNDLNVSKNDINIAEEVLGNLDDNGYLNLDIVLIQDKFNVSNDNMEALLYKIRHLDPPGISSRSVKECLLAQLELLYPNEKLAIEIVQNYFDDYSAHHYSKIIKKINCSQADLDSVISLIAVLNPCPSINYSQSANYNLIPDVIVENQNDAWIATANDEHLPSLYISDDYRKMLLSDNSDTSTKNFLKQKIQQANWFIDAVNNRYTTIIKIMNSIIKHQKTYFNFDDRVLSPLILKTIAEDINMDISTVSRATNDKFVQLPWGIVELKSFFSEGIKTKDGKMVSNSVIKNKIKELINNENKKNPFSDLEISEVLHEDGFIIARRTVAKYRESLGISTSRLRKK